VLLAYLTFVESLASNREVTTSKSQTYLLTENYDHFNLIAISKQLHVFSNMKISAEPILFTAKLFA
jgi:hypothetical protein